MGMMLGQHDGRTLSDHTGARLNAGSAGSWMGNPYAGPSLFQRGPVCESLWVPPTAVAHSGRLAWEASKPFLV